MSARTKKYLSIYIWIIFLFTVAIYMDNIMFRNTSLNLFVSIMSCVVYICIFVFWMMSIKWRCMHRRIRNYLMAVCAWLIFWMVLTLLQNEFAVLPLIKRQLWYLSYIPIVFVPLMGLCAASYASQPDTMPLGRKYWFFWIPSIIFSVLIITNELHGLVFDVNIYETHDIITKHSVLCWLMLCWAAALELFAITTLIVKSRVTTIHWSRIAVPITFFLCYIVYMILFYNDTIGESGIAMPVVNCFFHLAICESCLFFRLLPTNFYYTRFFENTDIGMQLLDVENEVKLRSHKARTLTEAEYSALKERGVIYVDGFEIYHKAVHGGYFLYEKDVREIQQEIDKLKSTINELEETNSYIEEDNRLKIQKSRLEEKERIYNEVSCIITPSLDKIDQLLKEIRTLDGDMQRRMMWYINLLGTYVKRRANLELRRNENPTVFGSELVQCLAEYDISLRASGITSSCFIESSIVITLESAILLLDIYAAIIEEQFQFLKSISIIQSREKRQLRFLIEALNRNGMAVSADKVRNFSAYAEKNGMKLHMVSDAEATTVGFILIIEEGVIEE